VWRQYCIERLMIRVYWLLKALYYFKIVISLGLVKLANNCLLQISFDCGIEFPEKWSGICLTGLTDCSDPVVVFVSHIPFISKKCMTVRVLQMY